MQQRLWLAFAVVLGVSFAVQVSWPVDLSDRPETTFDTAPRGHAGVFALLDRFDSTRGRWLSGLTMPSVDETIWWITPGGACERRTKDDAVDPGKEGSAARLSPFEITVRPWIEAGERRSSGSRIHHWTIPTRHPRRLRASLCRRRNPKRRTPWLCARTGRRVWRGHAKTYATASRFAVGRSPDIRCRPGEWLASKGGRPP